MHIRTTLSPIKLTASLRSLSSALPHPAFSIWMVANNTIKFVRRLFSRKRECAACCGDQTRCLSTVFFCGWCVLPSFFRSPNEPRGLAICVRPTAYTIMMEGPIRNGANFWPGFGPLSLYISLWEEAGGVFFWHGCTLSHTTIVSVCEHVWRYIKMSFAVDRRRCVVETGVFGGFWKRKWRMWSAERGVMDMWSTRVETLKNKHNVWALKTSSQWTLCCGIILLVLFGMHFYICCIIRTCLTIVLLIWNC